MKIIKQDELTEDFYRYGDIEETGSVERIISDVRRSGDEAVRKYSREFDGLELETFKIDDEEIKSAHSQMDERTISTLEEAAGSIKQFALKQMQQFSPFEVENRPGVFTGQKVIPIERVGIYAPAGKFPLPSTVLMCAVPAKVAGVKETALFSPPSHHGTVHPLIATAALLAGVDEIYRVGGVQAIAAMAYGTESIRAVHKIVGPGNKYVTAAKKLVYGIVGIDFIAGPSEVMIIADEDANPEFVAADLIAQAEHDEDAVAVLLTDSTKLANEVNRQIQAQLGRLPTGKTAGKALETSGRIIIVDSLSDAVAVANKKGPEHLQLMVSNPEPYIDELMNFGSLFIGEYCPVALGDYSSGLNHTLPTGGCARYASGLSVKDFLKFPTTLSVNSEGFGSIGQVAGYFAALEGMEGHGRSIVIRRKK